MIRRTTQSELNFFFERRRHGETFDDDYTFLQGKNLSTLNLAFANLNGLDLSDTVFCGANLCHAHLRKTNLSFADMMGANLYNADMRGADLLCANFHGANLSEADLRGSLNASGIPMACPEIGSFIAYKKARLCVAGERVIVELEIPCTAKRCSATTDKCRCDRANVLKIYDLRRHEMKSVKAVSLYDETFEYIPGEVVIVPDFDDDRWNECSTGIHFFMSFQEAVEY